MLPLDEAVSTCSPSDPHVIGYELIGLVLKVGLAVDSCFLDGLVRLCGFYPLSRCGFDQSPPYQTHDRQRLTPHQAYQDKAHVFVQHGDD